MENIIEIKNLTKTFKVKHKEGGLYGSFKSIFLPIFKEVKAINSISFNIKKGEIVGFIGPNGAGKSTTIKILSGILHPTSGEVNVLKIVPWKNRKKLSYKIGCVFGQKPQLWYHLPSIDTFNLLSKIYELDKKEYEKRMNYLVDLFEVRNFINVPVRKLSLGQRMRCEIIASLLHSPEILFLDEPTIGLDIVAKQKIRELISELNKKEKITILLTSHDIQDIERLCKRIIIINHGKIIYDGFLDRLEKGYLKNKIIKVKFSSLFKGLSNKGIKIIKAEEQEATFEVNTDIISIKRFIDTLINKYEIVDIDISAPPIEEIISKIFQEK